MVKKNEENAHSKRRQVMDIKNIKMQSSVLTNMSSSGGKNTTKNNNKNYQVKDSGEKKQTSYTVHKDEKSMVSGPLTTKPCRSILAAE